MHSRGGLFPDAKHHLRQLLASPVVWVVAMVIIGVQTAVAAMGGPEMVPRWFEWFGLERGCFLSGSIWQILTYGLLHGSWWHVGVNTMFLLALGSRIGYMTGWRVMMWVTVLGVIAGGVAHLLLGCGRLVGISGGCMALLMLLVTLSPESRMFPLPVSGRNLGLGIVISAMVMAMIDPSLGLPGFASIGKLLESRGLGACFRLGHACHVGGALAGWLVGRWILRPRVTIEDLRRDRARREAARID